MNKNEWVAIGLFCLFVFSSLSAIFIQSNQKNVWNHGYEQGKLVGWADCQGIYAKYEKEYDLCCNRYGCIENSRNSDWDLSTATINNTNLTCGKYGYVFGIKNDKQ